MLARFQELDAQWFVKTIGGDHAYGFQVGLLLKHFRDVAERIGNLVFFRCFCGGGLVHIANCDYVGIGFSKACRVVLEHAARADDSYFSSHSFQMRGNLTHFSFAFELFTTVSMKAIPIMPSLISGKS